MLARHGDVVEEDIAVGVAPRHDLVVIEEEACPGVRAAQDDEERGAGTQSLDGGEVGLGEDVVGLAHLLGPLGALDRLQPHRGRLGAARVLALVAHVEISLPSWGPASDTP